MRCVVGARPFSRRNFPIQTVPCPALVGIVQTDDTPFIPTAEA
jgi:hypothetical protein